MAVPAGEWLDLMETEYLGDYLREGGAAVKFVVAAPDTLDTVVDRLSSNATARAMRFVAIDAAATRIHMIQDVLFAVARQLDWQTLAQSFVEGLFHRQNYLWPHPGQATAIHDVAEANGVDVLILRREFHQWLTAEVMRRSDMTQDFRVAMMQLCRRCLMPADELVGPVDVPTVEWLTGELRSIVPLRQLHIGSKITRHNARAMLRSLCAWLWSCHVPGLVIVLDMRQLSRTGAATDGGLRYTPSAVLDAFEVLRQLIDDAERFRGMFLAVLADDGFVDGNLKRSIEAYTALKMRIWPDVHAKDRDNPLAPLVHLADAEGRP